MNPNRFAAVVFLGSLMIGLSFSASFYHGQELPELIQENLEGSQGKQADSGSLEYGSAHEHAFFWIVDNGSERDLTAEKFQLNSRYVHLENNRSDIVHKHAEGVTWNRFLDTVNTTVAYTNGSRICVEVFESSGCGEGGAFLNGQKIKDFDREISQGDNFLVIFDTDNWKQEVKDYMREQLPKIYKPSESRGNRI